MSGEASFPQWLNASSLVEFIYKIPLRVFYFLFSPFPWDITKAHHIIGLFDAFFFICISYLIFLNRKLIWKDPVLKIIFFTLICYLLVF